MEHSLSNTLPSLFSLCYVFTLFRAYWYMYFAVCICAYPLNPCEIHACVWLYMMPVDSGMVCLDSQAMLGIYI